MSKPLTKRQREILTAAMEQADKGETIWGGGRFCFNHRHCDALVTLGLLEVFKRYGEKSAQYSITNAGRMELINGR